MPLQVTLSSFEVLRADGEDHETSAQWRAQFTGSSNSLFQTSSSDPPPEFRAAFKQDGVHDNEPFNDVFPIGESFTVPDGSGFSLKINGFERDGSVIGVNDLLPTLDVSLSPQFMGNLPFGSAGFHYNVIVAAGLESPESTFFETAALTAALPGETNHLFGSGQTSIPFLPFIQTVNTEGLPPSFSQHDLSYLELWTVDSGGSAENVRVGLNNFFVILAGEDGDNHLGEWHPTFEALSNAAPAQVRAQPLPFSTPELLVHDNQFISTDIINHTFPVDPSGNQSLLLRTSGFEDDSRSTNSPIHEMLPLSAVIITPNTGSLFEGRSSAFDVTMMVDDGSFGYAAGWHVVSI